MADTVDHVKPISDGGHPFPALDGLTSYCASCHSKKTARIDKRGAAATSKVHGGCTRDGTPTDPNHWWLK
ncbi:HNH endonuclease [alpha proteobacterium Q-1]|nr:HNH endonuclease [alpha proteobacterium Q-1]